MNSGRHGHSSVFCCRVKLDKAEQAREQSVELTPRCLVKKAGPLIEMTHFTETVLPKQNRTKKEND